ncbi:transcription factor TFIIIB subunit brf1 [Pseudogymnoascus verrucosus]|uniref:Transcription factor TFIIIB subunit brf1 n=1 Tax=Pseudogymnoascus verrucosus TaxID=342668 RepID=A0A1B8GKN4_9PEZI|nr:transcription factor TFIIIB subunit brf1 [Pseudogymnoascus verrucosus]OBT96392.1 transcription factor TFIIIB subunit brf1 [Pseudogymnoascus verrucosus]
MGRTPNPPKVKRPNPLSTIRPIRAPTPVARPPPPVGPPKARRLCPNKTCPAPKIEDGICKTCGTIVEESTIVSEIQFGESASGAAVVQGSFVGAGSGAAKSMGPAFQRAGGGTEDREKTLREGKRIMQGFAGEHKIPESVLNSGVQIFKLAAMNNFIQGRRMNTVAAVCLYTAARKERPCRVMLIDFADSCGVNVFKLGHTFKALHQKISISADGIMPVLPEDLIYRFATKLEFGQDTTKVAESAVRLVQRMSLDWMVMGRRPSGICGACLILAARMHNFRRTVKEVVYIVKVTTATIQKRLEEFKVTASSDLTVEEFLSNQFLESAHDPPAFYQQSESYIATKKKRKRKRHPLEGPEGDDEESEIQRILDSASRQSSVASSIDPGLEINPSGAVRRDADGFAVPPLPAAKAIPIDPALLENTDNDDSLNRLVAEYGEDLPPGDGPLKTSASPGSPGKVNGKGATPPPSASAKSVVDQAWEEDEEEIEDEISEMIADPHTIEHAKAFATAEQRARVHAMLAYAQAPQVSIPMTASVDESEFADDPEVANCLLSEAEAAIKEHIWVNANKDWLRDQAVKLYNQKIADKAPKARRNRVKRPRIGEGQTRAASSPAEAAVEVLKERTWSKRINYDAIRGIFEGPGSKATSAAPSVVAEEEEEGDVESTAEDYRVDGEGGVGNELLEELEEEEDVEEDVDEGWEEGMEDEDF